MKPGFIRDGLLLPEKETPAVDELLNTSFQEAHLGAQEIYKDLSISDPERKSQITQALKSGESVSLAATHLDIEFLDKRLKTLKEWKRNLIADESVDSEVKQLYRWRVNEDIANIYILAASYTGNEKAYKKWNEFIYGKPNEDIYRAALDWVGNDAEKIISDKSASEFAKQAAQDVLDKLDGKRGDRNVLIPDSEVYEKVREDHFGELGYYALLLAGIDVPNDGKINNETGDPILRHVIRNNLKSNYGLADASGATWGVAHSTESIERPSKYDMPWRRFVGLGLGHEIGSHLLEKENAERGPLMLAASGLDRYEQGNEGRGVVREEIMYSTFNEFGKQLRWRDIMRRHISISYGYGLEGGQKSPAEVYDFMHTIDTMYAAKTSENLDEAKEKATSKTESLVTRSLRGVGENGGAYLKDKTYLEGHVAVWTVAAKRGVKAISEGDLGKFDINNPRHISALQKLGLLPDEMQ